MSTSNYASNDTYLGTPGTITLGNVSTLTPLTYTIPASTITTTGYSTTWVGVDSYGNQPYITPPPPPENGLRYVPAIPSREEVKQLAIMYGLLPPEDTDAEEREILEMIKSKRIIRFED